jgi:hypothetical protein
MAGAGAGLNSPGRSTQLASKPRFVHRLVSDASRQIQLNPVARPSGDTCSKEIGVFSPDGAVEGHRAGQHGPIVFITRGNTRKHFFLHVGMVAKAA